MENVSIRRDLSDMKKENERLRLAMKKDRLVEGVEIGESDDKYSRIPIEEIEDRTNKVKDELGEVEKIIKQLSKKGGDQDCRNNMEGRKSLGDKEVEDEGMYKRRTLSQEEAAGDSNGLSKWRIEVEKEISSLKEKTLGIREEIIGT